MEHYRVCGLNLHGEGRGVILPASGGLLQNIVHSDLDNEVRRGPFT